MTIVRKRLGLDNVIINFNTLAFWNKFCIIIFTSIIWLCFLSLIGASSLNQITNPLKFASSTSLIVEIYPESSAPRTNSKISLVKEILDASPLITSYHIVPEEKIISMISDYSSNFQDSLNPVSLPTIISAQISSFSAENLQNLRISLSQKVNTVYVDTEKELLQRLANPVLATKYMVIMVPIISLFVLSSILFLITYAMLFYNRKTIETVLFLGAFRRTISIEFSLWILQKTFLACLFAAVLSVVTMLCFLYLFNFNSLPVGTYLLFLCAVIIILPAVSGIVSSWFISRIVNANTIKELL